MIDILGMSRSELAGLLLEMGEPRYRADQLFKWIHKRGSKSFVEMTDLPASLRKRLKDSACLSVIKTAYSRKSKDGTEKLGFQTRDGVVIESVLIPDVETGRLTLCVSSQVGCRMGCSFCRTARIGFRRNLRVSELVGQVLAASRRVAVDSRITNLVFMGMGEPLANLKRVVKALEILMDEFGMNFSSRRITVSTSGIIPAMNLLGRAVPVKLAVSLNAADDDTRTRLMPVNRKYPLPRLMEACKSYPLARRDRITFEYVLIKDENDSIEDARNLVKLLSHVKCKVNLIPFNEFQGCSYERPPAGRVASFQRLLLSKGIPAMLRESRGDDISAACGQLAGTYMQDEHEWYCGPASR